MINIGSRYCSKCRRTLDESNFYTLKDGTKSELCKACETMHINNFDPETFKWLLERYDVPYIPEEWNILRDRAYQKDPYKMTGMSVFGKYLSKMKLKQWKNFGYADSEKLQEEAAEKAKLFGTPPEEYQQKVEQMEKAYKDGEISEAQFKTYKEVTKPEPSFAEVAGAVVPALGEKAPNPYPANDNPFEQVDIPDVGKDLTEDDKIYLAVKWGRLYSAADWVYLEQKYNDFMSTFDIQGAARIDTLVQICKLSLKMNQALDSGDMDSYSKLVRAYDSLMKSAKFTEAQNKETDTGDFDSIGAIVAFCEKEGGFIPEYEITAPQDVIDTIIQDNKDYLQSLIHNDSNISQQIEQFLKKQTILQEQKEERKKLREKGLEDLGLTDKDHADFYAAIEKDKQEDELLLMGEDE